MTNVADTDATPARVSDTRLAAMLKDANDIQPGRVRMSEQEVTELRCALAELQERRRNSLPTSVTDEQVKLACEAHDGKNAGFHYTDSTRMRAALSAASLPLRDDAQPNIGGGEWRTDVIDGVHACHVEAARFDHDGGEWVVGIVFAPPGKPWTHWRHLGPMPDALSALSPSSPKQGVKE